MSAQRFELDRVIISSQQVLVSSSASCTTFVNDSRCETLNLEELMETYKNIVRKAKQRGIKVSFRRKPLSMKARILELETSYYYNMNVYNSLFDSLVDAWNALIEEGLYRGIDDNKAYKRAVEISHKMNRMISHSSVIGKAIDIRNALNASENRLQAKGTSKIYL